MSFCCILDCSNRKTRELTKSFYRLPAIITKQGAEIEKISRRRRQQWISNISRDDLKCISSWRVCSDHFVSGKPSTDEENVDWVPSINLGHSKLQNKKISDTSRSERMKKRQLILPSNQLNIQSPVQPDVAPSNSDPEINSGQNDLAKI
uniref:THAP-type domain-containing protein n=1 Tax=Strigamia maritima TaxID=126957 RepID=T1IH87_STRMM